MAKHYTDEEWFEIIKECRTSGITQRQWCREHKISISAYYSHVNELTEKGYEVPAAEKTINSSGREIVEVSSQICDTPGQGTGQICTDNSLTETAVRMVFKGIPLEITNAASGNTLTKVFKALEEVC